MEEQINSINSYCIENWIPAEKEYNLTEVNNDFVKIKRLRQCSATVFETENYYFLKSFDTIVAFINKNTGYIFDILRYVYGYTSVSNQHIAKFVNDYSPDWRTRKRFTWHKLKDRKSKNK